MKDNFDYVGDFHEGFARIKLNDKWNFIDKKCKLLSPNQWFDFAYDFNSDTTAMLNNKWYLLNRESVPVRLNDKWYFLNREGILLEHPTKGPVVTTENKQDIETQNNPTLTTLSDFSEPGDYIISINNEHHRVYVSSAFIEYKTLHVVVKTEEDSHYVLYYNETQKTFIFDNLNELDTMIGDKSNEILNEIDLDYIEQQNKIFETRQELITVLSDLLEDCKKPFGVIINKLIKDADTEYAKWTDEDWLNNLNKLE